MFIVVRICYDFDTFTENVLRTVNFENIIVVPDEFSEAIASDLRNYEDQLNNKEAVSPSQLPSHK